MDGGLRLTSLKEDQHESNQNDDNMDDSQDDNMNDRSTTSDEDPQKRIKANVDNIMKRLYEDVKPPAAGIEKYSLERI